MSGLTHYLSIFGKTALSPSLLLNGLAWKSESSLLSSLPILRVHLFRNSPRKGTDERKENYLCSRSARFGKDLSYSSLKYCVRVLAREEESCQPFSSSFPILLKVLNSPDSSIRTASLSCPQVLSNGVTWIFLGLGPETKGHNSRKTRNYPAHFWAPNHKNGSLLLDKFWLMFSYNCLFMSILMWKGLPPENEFPAFSLPEFHERTFFCTSFLLKTISCHFTPPRKQNQYPPLNSRLARTSCDSLQTETNQARL